MCVGVFFNPTEAAHRVSGSLDANGFSHISDNLNVNFATTVTPAGSLALQVAKINGRLLDLELTALERENNVEIIASPRLLTTNKKSASIKQGDRNSLCGDKWGKMTLNQWNFEKRCWD